MSGTALQSFTTFAQSEGEAWFTGVDEVVNDVGKNTYTIPRLHAGLNAEDMIQGGETIRDIIYLKKVKTSKRYQPNAEFATYTNTNTGTINESPWRFLEADYSVTKQELGLNFGQLNTKTKVHKFKTVLRQKLQNLWQDMCDQMDEELWAPVDEAGMEQTDGTLPYSLLAYINEYTNGLAAAGQDAGGTAWTTVQGISRVNNANWRNVQQGYSQGAVAGTDLFSALSKAFHKCKFDRLPKGAEYSEPTTSPNFIGTSLQGIANYEDAIRVNQDGMQGSFGPQDPDYNKPMFRGVPLDYIAELDTAAVFPTGGAGGQGGALSTELDTSGDTNAGPRYFGVNGKYLRCFYHDDAYFDMLPMFSPSKQPFTKVQVVDTWNNMFLRSGRRHFIVYPTADIASS